ncbi:hypothetical protein J6590_057565 [Homalodisca vitripennis]|nr:hypothetical protein J6590_057565 [Homalodisca vitripennis]
MSQVGLGGDVRIPAVDKAMSVVMNVYNSATRCLCPSINPARVVQNVELSLVSNTQAVMNRGSITFRALSVQSVEFSIHYSGCGGINFRVLSVESVEFGIHYLGCNESW